MKLFSKVAVLAAALMVVSVFAGCKNAEDEGAGVVAEFDGYLDNSKLKSEAIDSSRAADETPDYSKPILNLKFYDDDTFVVEAVQMYEGVFAEGTYKGDPSKDGEVIITFSAMVNMKSESTELQPVGDNAKYVNGPYEIEDGVLRFQMFKFVRVEE